MHEDYGGRATAGSASRDGPLGWRAACDDLRVSRRDQVRLLNALWRLSDGVDGVGSPVAALEMAIGRGHGDMRTPLNLQTLNEDGLARRLPDGTWALTPEGIAWLRQDRELSDR